MKDHTVVVPDLRGIGRSSKPTGGYDKKTQAQDVRAVVSALGCDRTFVVAHDIGNMVAYAYAATYPERVERLVVMDAPIPGIDPWNEILQNPGVWHFNFHGPDAERLCRAENASTLTGYGTTSRGIRANRMRPLEISSQPHTLSQVE